jgi:bifunctional non-homologous end joining protein LigD
MAFIAPMLATLEEASLEDESLVYEPKYDGIRAIVEIEPNGGVHLWSRLGNEKTQQFPEIATALKRWARRRKQPLVLDGEIVALDANGEPAGFQQLQGRIHLSEGDGAAGRTALIVFDILREGRTDYRDRPLLERRAALEKLFGRTGSPLLRISEQVRGDGRAL